ncbi:thiamine-phosphate kinase [Bacterioplanes sanyensis]|uniref:Thiamine-monophosphate kinase n=1 Tax=Bacterioplanes sanyensis TaxID=1249553 RepID=A0A222FQI6_9GAMM|nr:thiamine-phosphate kinase [Bacterioplanes sanyensis]ASP40661.1 thiamine-phosphate kinase [Bacterioplanes sanyensis]
MSGHEFALIRRHFADGYPLSPQTVLAVGDDASIVAPPVGAQLVQSIDTQVADVHFPATAPAQLIAARALRCAASDLAAMGATPQGFHLALTLPDAKAEWLQDFATGLRQHAHQLDLQLLGGDTTRGQQLVISIAVQGWVDDGTALRRDGAQAGEQLWLSGPLGAAALALPEVLKTPGKSTGWASHYYFPAVHTELGLALRGIASSCLDISDGLLQDAGHIARASDVTIMIDAEKVETAIDQADTRWPLCFSGGDDYQLLFSVSLQQASVMQTLQQSFPNMHCIGEAQAANGNPCVILHKDGQPLDLQQTGFQHF